MEQCTTERIVVSLPAWSYFEQTERTVETIVSIAWNGVCVDGKRDGAGLLTWAEETTKKERTGRKDYMESRTITTYTSEGRFVKGQRLGLWCTTMAFEVATKTTAPGNVHKTTSPGGCSVFAGHTKPLTSNYRKEPDGRWREYGSRPTDSILAAGTLEAQSAKVLADAAAGKTDLKVDLVVHNQSLDDLVPGSKIVLAPSDGPIQLKDKRIAVVLSSQAISELERFARERQALIAASAGLHGEAAKARATFIQVSDPDRLLINIAKTVRKYAKEVQVAEDLSVLTQNKCDYALVVDWRSLTRFDQLGRFDSVPISPEEDKQAAYERRLAKSMEEEKRTPYAQRLAEAISKGTVDYGDVMGGFLINRELKAVKHFPAEIRNAVLKSTHINPSTGDHAYFEFLAVHFGVGLGKGPDDLGNSTWFLDFFLKGLAKNPSMTH